MTALGVRSDFAAQVGAIHLKILPLAIGKNHACAGVYWCDGAGDESMTWNDNRSALHTDRAEDQLYRTGTSGRGQGVFHSAIFCLLTLELLHVCSHADKPASKDLLEGSQH